MHLAHWSRNGLRVDHSCSLGMQGIHMRDSRTVCVHCERCTSCNEHYSEQLCANQQCHYSVPTVPQHYSADDSHHCSFPVFRYLLLQNHCSSLALMVNLADCQSVEMTPAVLLFEDPTDSPDKIWQEYDSCQILIVRIHCTHFAGQGLGLQNTLHTTDADMAVPCRNYGDYNTVHRKTGCNSHLPLS